MRKVKCDEARPHCRRCLEDGRACQGYDDRERQHRSKPPEQLLPLSGSSTLQAAPPSALGSSHQQTAPASHHRVPPLHTLDSTHPPPPQAVTPQSHPTTSPQHLDDWLDLLCSSIGADLPPSNSTATVSSSLSAQSQHANDDKQGPLELAAQTQQAAPSSCNKSTPSQDAQSSSEHGLSTLASAAAGIHHSPSHLDSPVWLNEGWLSILTASPADSMHHIERHDESTSPPPARTRLPALEHISETELQRRIRALCVTKVQLESVSFFFNTTARCFHLLSADTNVWRIFFAQLASESPVILDLVGCLGLTHLSLTHDHRKKGLAHAHFSRCKTEWDTSIRLLDAMRCCWMAARPA